MRRTRVLVLLLAAAGVPARAQDPAPVYQTQNKKAFTFAGDSFARYEWTQDIPNPPDGTKNENRYQVQARPRVELSMGPVELGVGGQFTYSDVDNDVPPPGQDALLIVRDNYHSRGARFDLYYAKVKAGPVTAQGGRFAMPIAFTEMIWDRELRPQGGAVTIGTKDASAPTRIALTGLFATGSQVFGDQSQMFAGSLDLSFRAGNRSRIELTGSYLTFRDLAKLDHVTWRQNSLVDGLLLDNYDVIDAVARIVVGGTLPFQLVGDFCWNVALSERNHGLWLALVLGEIGTSRAAFQYTYSSIDKDATVAAFDTGDFFWGTGWQGHRFDLGTSLGKGNSVHGIAQWQRFKDGPTPEIQQEWVKRYRIEWRTVF